MDRYKNLTVLGAALFLITVSTPVLAFECEGNGNAFDRETIYNNLVTLAEQLRCAPGTDANPGTWPDDNPIWERRGEPSCDVHERLARNLDEDRELDENSTKPRKNKNNSAKGAANEVKNGHFEDAISHLAMLITAVNNSRPNRDFYPDVMAAKYQAMLLVNEAQEASICISQLLP